MTYRAAERDALVESLTKLGRVRVPLEIVWELWSTAAPRLVAHPDQAAALTAALTAAADDGTVELPSGAWDRSTVPPLPRSIVVPAARKTARAAPWKRRAWHPALGWVSSLPSLSPDRFDDLVAIDAWLQATDGGNAPVLPIRYRSVQLFGNEKRLETMSRTALFGPTRLTLELLACERLPSPLPAVSVGDGCDVLVVENSDTYWVAARAALGACGPIGAVAWGSGNAFPSQVTSLGVDVAGRGPATGTIWYWGDLDPAGVSIAAQAASAAATAGLAALRPAQDLWSATARATLQDIGTVHWPTAIDTAWFGDELWNRFAPVVDAGARVAQEAVGIDVLEAWMRQPH